MHIRPRLTNKCESEIQLSTDNIGRHGKSLRVGYLAIALINGDLSLLVPELEGFQFPVYGWTVDTIIKYEYAHLFIKSIKAILEHTTTTNKTPAIRQKPKTLFFPSHRQGEGDAADYGPGDAALVALLE